MIGEKSPPKTSETSHLGEDERRIVPLFGKDEMNLIEFPFGPITQTAGKTLEVEHQVFDRTLRRDVKRRMIITGSDAFGLPRPIDDQVLIGMKALSHESGYSSRRVEFSRYHLCRVIGWEPDGRAYKRLEESLDRIAGTTLKFKDAWWDKGEKEWKSKTFHLIEEANLCSRDELDRKREASGRAEQRLCSFVWSDVIWKSFQDGFIKTLDMQMFRRVASGRRREVPLRLFRILDKRFHHADVARFELERLCVGTLGLCRDYSPSQMLRILSRAAKWLVQCQYLANMRFETEEGGRPAKVVFRKMTERHPRRSKTSLPQGARYDGSSACCEKGAGDTHRVWLAQQCEHELFQWEAQALESHFGSDLERRIVLEERSLAKPVLQSRRIRQEYIRRFVTSESKKSA